MIEAACYPGKRGLESLEALRQWQLFVGGNTGRFAANGMARHWFEMYDREDDLHDVYVTQEFLSVQAMGTLVVLLTLDDDDLFAETEDESDIED